jgi:LacI family transcriptional regulator
VAVPDQVSVVGIDDVQFSSLVSPALSTVRIPRRDLGTRAVDELTALLHHTNSPGDLRPVVLDSQFIPRTSSGPASAPAPAANR